MNSIDINHVVNLRRQYSFYKINAIIFQIFQRFHEFYIRKTHPEIKVIRRTLTEIHQQGALGPNNQLKM